MTKTNAEIQADWWQAKVDRLKVDLSEAKKQLRRWTNSIPTTKRDA